MKSAPQKPQQKAPEMPQKMSVAPAEPPPSADKSDFVRVAPTPDLNPRNRVAAEIAIRANETAEVDAAETVPEEGETASDAPAPQVAAETAPEAAGDAPAADAPQAAAPAADAPAPAPAAPAALPGIDANTEYDFIVDGVPTKIKGSQVIARVQKGETADYRLNLASRLLDEAKRAAAPQGQPPAQGAVQQQPQAQEPALDESQLANLIQFGTTEQAAGAIKALRAVRPDTVTQQGMQTFMAQQLPRIVESQLAFREGLSLVKSQYGDILEDADLRQLFFLKENAAREAGDKRPHADLYKDIGEDLRKKFNRPAPPTGAAPTQQAAPAQSIAQKQAAKVAAPAAPRLASARMEGGTPTVKPKSREEIINEVRRSRGQHAL